jgi:hypothetical protein
MVIEIPVPGDRIILVKMTAAKPVPRGSRGTIRSVHLDPVHKDRITIGMRWDDPSEVTSVMLPFDEYITVDKID